MGDGDENDGGLAERLARFWLAANRTAFFALLANEALDKIRCLLMSRLGLQSADAEDCVSQALESFVERREPAGISDPYAYLRRAAWNNGVTLHRVRRREFVLTVEALSPAAPEGAADALAAATVSAAWAIVVVEESISDIEADEAWAVAVVEAALERLTPKQRALLAYLSNLDFDFVRRDFTVTSQQAGEALGLSPAAFRKAKQRAYEALQLAIPAVIAELHVELPARFVSALEDSRRPVVGEDDVEGLG